MERRIGSALILIEDKQEVAQLNQIISRHSDIIIGRQGLPLRNYGFNVISLILDGNSDQISSLTGQLGRLKGIQVKSVMLKPVHDAIEND
ncbi:MAG: CopG family transcriptional regulator [Bacteroidota bacterium]|nr:CopG family transcriptional regulator [Bacteroidota bacterium]